MKGAAPEAGWLPNIFPPDGVLFVAGALAPKLKPPD